MQPDGSVQTHTGVTARVQRCFVDEIGHVYLETDVGFGLVHTQDITQAAQCVEDGLWVPLEVAQQALAERFGYCISPQIKQHS